LASIKSFSASSGLLIGGIVACAWAVDGIASPMAPPSAPAMAPATDVCNRRRRDNCVWYGYSDTFLQHAQPIPVWSVISAFPV